MLSFLIAEDHGVARMGTAMVIQSMYGDAHISEAETFEEVVRLLQTRQFDLAIMEIQMPGGDGLHMIPTLKLHQPDLSILIFSSYEEKLYAVRYLKAGAKGFLHKSAHPDVLRSAISTTLSGETFLSQEMHRRLLEDHLGGHKNGDLLSAREMEVMQLLVRGATSAEIRDELNIRSSTVSTHKARIFEKMGVTNIVELARKAGQSDV